MLNSVIVQRALRTLAIAIVIAAVIDPSISSTRRVPPTVAVIGGETEPELAAEVTRALGDDFTVVDGAFGGADASVLVDLDITTAAMLSAARQPVIAVTHPVSMPQVRIAAVDAPTVSSTREAVAINTIIETSGSLQDSVAIELREAGTLLDRRVIRTPAARATPVALAYSPRTPGAVTLTVHAAAIGDRAVADSATIMVDVRDETLRILFFDARASWMSTFVRRTLEADRRFDVSSRTSTSRSLSTSAGDAPSSLADANRFAEFDAVVVGAPDAVSAASVSGLDRYLRERGGAVLLLFDAPIAGSIRTLTGEFAWQMLQSETARPVMMNGRRDSARIATSDSSQPPALRVSEMMFPAALPQLATTHGTVAADRQMPVLFELPVGAGRLLVSTAFDAWRYREPGQSRFAEVWPSLVGDIAASSVDRLQVRVTPSLASNGERLALSVTLRDLALGAVEPRGVDVRATASLQVNGARIPIRLYPALTPGTFVGSFRAPEDSGAHVVSASISMGPAVVTDSVVIRIDDRVRRSGRVSPALRASIATASGGAVIESSRLVDLARAIDDVAPGASQRVMWHPMRSPWWLLPFAFLLGVEWWLRRRGGRP